MAEEVSTELAKKIFNETMEEIKRLESLQVQPAEGSRNAILTGELFEDWDVSEISAKNYEQLLEEALTVEHKLKIYVPKRLEEKKLEKPAPEELIPKKEEKKAERKFSPVVEEEKETAEEEYMQKMHEKLIKVVAEEKPEAPQTPAPAPAVLPKELPELAKPAPAPKKTLYEKMERVIEKKPTKEAPKEQKGGKEIDEEKKRKVELQRKRLVELNAELAEKIKTRREEKDKKKKLEELSKQLDELEEG